MKCTFLLRSNTHKHMHMQKHTHKHKHKHQHKHKHKQTHKQTHTNKHTNKQTNPQKQTRKTITQPHTHTTTHTNTHKHTPELARMGMAFGELSHDLHLLSSSIFLVCGTFTVGWSYVQAWSRRHLCSRNRILLVVYFRCRCRQNGGCEFIV